MTMKKKIIILSSILLVALVIVGSTIMFLGRAKKAGTSVLQGRQILLQALYKEKVFGVGRMVLHLSHVGNLTVAKQEYLVVDLEELVKDAIAPRTVKTILILNQKLKLISRFTYTVERPLFCRGANLYLSGNLQLKSVSGEGNVLTFGADGKVVKLSKIEANILPAPVVVAEKLQ